LASAAVVIKPRTKVARMYINPPRAA
jgi:hypothetical protein